MWYSQIAYQTEQLLLKKLFNLMFSLESDKITALWPNDSLTFISYVIISNSVPNWVTFLEKFVDLMNSLESDKITALWPNDS